MSAATNILSDKINLTLGAATKTVTTTTVKNGQTFTTRKTYPSNYNVSGTDLVNQSTSATTSAATDLLNSAGDVIDNASNIFSNWQLILIGALIFILIIRR